MVTDNLSTLQIRELSKFTLVILRFGALLALCQFQMPFQFSFLSKPNFSFCISLYLLKSCHANHVS